ncbi:hypothetical protein BG015_010964 [Linnemannia schmuckeri]|uniref:Dynamin-binding protein n=1 Tax=Linnemannia schmuckeri TaxID=64567 RepID=A0A9P5RVF1_9FUNG|nr:hypothetical protein BG015_010964 [Linnemannia schmuckeri]
MSSDPLYLIRTRSVGAEKRAPPPIKPKPSTLISPSTDTSAVSSPIPAFHQQQSHVTVTPNGAPTSSSFGDLRKTFERQQNNSPLFMSSTGAQITGTAPRGAGLGVPRGSTSAGQLSHHASISHVQQYSNNVSQLAPSFGNVNSNNNSNNNRPRSVSSPGPPLRDTDDDAEGIDNSQPDFGNLRARFQSHMSLPGQGAPKLDTPRPKPKPAIEAKPTFQNTTSPSPILPSSRMSMDSSFNNSSSIASVPRFVPSQPTSTAGSSVVLSRLSSNSYKQPPRPPPMKTHSPAPKTLTPPRTPPRVETPESERNPFMGSDEDEASASHKITAPSAPSRANSFSNQLSNSKIQQNPVFQQLRNQAIRQPTATMPGRDSVLVGKAAPPPPQRAAPRPDSPQGLPPKLPSRANSAIHAVQDTPAEKERKHRLNKRRRVVQELLETEISFSKDMLLLQEVYVTDMSDSPLFTQADVKIVFTNLADVVALTLDFIAFLTPACGGGTVEEYDDSSTFVGEAFLQMISRIRRVYSEYCKRQETSAQHLQDLDNRRDLKPFFDACTQKCKGKTTGWDLASLLIKPVQRVLKYPLLINQIHALTPSDHQDFESLANVQKEMLLVAEEINEIKKRKDIVEKIVGSKKKNDSDFARTTQQLRQAVGGSDVTVDILFEALLEKFNLQQRLVREFAKYIQSWLVSIKQFFDTQEAFATTLADIYGMVPIHRTKENQSLILVHEFHKNLVQFSKTIGRELESRLKKTVYKSIERFLKLFSGPLQVMKKREKKLLDYDNVRGMKDRGETIDKNMLDSAAAYTAINEQLVDELPKFLGLTTQYFDIIVMEFSQVQQYFYTQVKTRSHEFFTEHVDCACSRDLAAYLDQMDICEDYIEAMTRNDGPLERLNRISLIHDVSATHEAAFQGMRDTVVQRLRRNASHPLQARSRSSPIASPIPTTPGKSAPSWHSPSESQSSLQSPLQPQPRFYPGEDENPFEVPESIFHDGSATSYDDYEPFGNNNRGDESYSFGGDRPLSMASTYSFNSASTDQQEFCSKPPELDDGMDMDEIGIAQALFECTAIYPYSSTEDRQLNFEAGESIIVFGLNDNGWYFGKKVGKDTTGWFPASHCIQI